MTHELVRVVRPGTEPGGPVLVLLHGLGSNERDLMAFAPYLDPRLTVVAYRAPHAYGTGGYAWFGIDWTPEGRVVDVEAASASVAVLETSLAALREELRPARLVLGGFSQGAMMTLGVALSRPELLDAGLLMSGHPWPSAGVDRLSVPFLVQHGVRDEVLPIEAGREVRRDLEALGAPVEYREYPMGHEVTLESLQEAIAWIARQAF